MATNHGCWRNVAGDGVDLRYIHGANYRSAGGGEVASLKKYAKLTDEGGHLDKMRTSSRPGTVKIALCGTKHAFAYTRQVTKSLPSDFCREAEERIGAWMRGLRTDILRERHQTCEHEDAIVVAIVQVLPLFDTLASVREASCLLNSLSAPRRGRRASTAVAVHPCTRLRDARSCPRERPALWGYSAYDGK